MSIRGQNEPVTEARETDRDARLASALNWGLPVAVIVLIALMLSEGDSQLFHRLVGALIAAAAWAVFLLAWSGRRLIDNRGLLVLGLASLFVGFMQLVHALEPSALGAHSEADTQARVWLAARLLSALSFIAFVVAQRRPLNIPAVWGLFGVLTALLLVEARGLHLMPACVTADGVSTAYRRLAEGALAGLFLAAAWLAWRLRGTPPVPAVVSFVVVAAVLGAGAQLTMAVPARPQDAHSVVSHLLLFLSYCMLYASLVYGALSDPFAWLFGRWRRAAVAHEQSAAELQWLLQEMHEGIVTRDANGQVTSANPAALRILGLTQAQLRGEAPVPPGWRMLREDGTEFALEDTPWSVALRTGGRTGPVLMGFCHAGAAETVWALVGATLDQRPGDTRAGGTCSTLTDVTALIRTERGLRQSEERFRRQFEDHTAVQVLIDPETGRILDANPAAARFYGWSRAELTQMTVLDINALPPEEVRAAMARACAEKQVRFDFQHRRADGSVCDVLVHSGAIRLADRTVLHSIVHDVTNQRRAEEAVRRSEAWLRGMTETLPALVWTAGTTGDLEYITERLVQFAGVPRASLMGMGYLQLVHPDDLAPLQASVAECIEHFTPLDTVHRLRRHDGVYRWFRSQSLPVRGDDGEPIRWFGVSIDVTTRREAEDALCERESRLTELTERLPALVWSLRPDGTQESLTQQGAEYLGVTLDDLADRNMFGWAHPDDGDVFGAAARQAQAGADSVLVEARLRRHDGAYRWFAHRISVVRDEAGTAVRWLGVSADITDQREAEAALRESQALMAAAFETSDDLLIVKSHDGVIRAANPAVAQFLGLPLEEIVGKTDHDLLPGDEAALNEAAERAIADGLGSAAADVQVTGAWGPRWFHAVRTPILSAAGECTGLLISARNMDERHTVEEALRESEQWLRQVADSMPALVWATLPNGQGVYTNPYYTEYTGRTAQELRGYGWLDSVHPDDRTETTESWQQAGAAGKAWATEARMRQHDGAYRWFAARSVPIRNSDGEIAIWFGSAVDIHELKTAQQTLERNAALSDMARRIEELYLSQAVPELVMADFARAATEATGSEVGLISEVDWVAGDDSELVPKLRHLAVIGVAWAGDNGGGSAEPPDHFADASGLCLQTVLTGEVVVANNLAADESHAAVPAGHPPVHSYIGLPVRFGGELVGIVGLANRPEGYTDDVAATLEPLVGACAVVINDMRRARREADYLQQVETREKDFRELFETMEQGVLYVYPDGSLGRANPAATRIAGLTEEEIRQRNFSDPRWVVVDEQLHPVPPAERAAWLALRTGEVVRDVVVGIRNQARGDIRWLQMSAFPEFLPGSDAPVRALMIFTDVTERRLAERRLRETTDRLQYALEATNEGVWDWDLQTGEIVWSEQWLSALGYSREEAVGDMEFLIGITHPWDVQRLQAALTAHLEGRTPTFVCEHRLKCSWGGYLETLAQGKVVRRDEHGSPLRMVGTYVDITERNRANAELRRLSQGLVNAQEAERTRIAAELHDEIGQTLTGLTLLLEEHPGLSEEVFHSRVGTARTEARQLLATVSEMMLDLRPPMLSDLGLLEALRAHLRRYKQQTGITVEFDAAGFGGEPSPDVATTVYRIVQEALTNVARHADIDCARVTLSLEGERIRLRVRDDGKGFNPEDQPDQSMGLSGMRERARAIGGVLEVASRPGEGTTIEASLPSARRLGGRGDDSATLGG